MKKTPKEDYELLYESLLQLKSVEECRKFMEDLCTVTELKAMGQRIEVAMYLREGMIYQDILKHTVNSFGRHNIAGRKRQNIRCRKYCRDRIVQYVRTGINDNHIKLTQFQILYDRTHRAIIDSDTLRFDFRRREHIQPRFVLLQIILLDIPFGKENGIHLFCFFILFGNIVGPLLDIRLKRQTEQR